MSPSLAAYRLRNQDAPLELIVESPEWQPVIRLINGWAKQPLGVSSGYSSDELDAVSRRHGLRFPPALREWWRLAGRHPFVAPGLMPDNARLLGPDEVVPFSRADFLMVAVDDIQTESGNGFHADLLSQPDPEIVGINTTITPEDAPGLDWSKGGFIGTGLRMPALAFTTLLSHLFEPSPLVRAGVVYLRTDRNGLRGGQPDDRLVSQLRLARYPNPTLVGDSYSDGEVIYHWMRGCACRSAEAAERVRRADPQAVPW